MPLCLPYHLGELGTPVEFGGMSIAQRSEVAGAISNLLICLNYGVFQSSCLLAASVKSIAMDGYFFFSFFPTIFFLSGFNPLLAR